MLIFQCNKDNASLRANMEMLTAHCKVFGFPKFRVPLHVRISLGPHFCLFVSITLWDSGNWEKRKEAYILIIAITVSNKQSFVSYSGIFFFPSSTSIHERVVVSLVACK